MAPKYRRSTLNGVLLTFFNQFTGITGIVIFSTTIFTEMRDKGAFDIPIMVAVHIINVACFVGSILCSIPPRYFSQKQVLQGGLFILCLSKVLIAVFIQIKFNAGILICMAIFLFTF